MGYRDEIKRNIERSQQKSAPYKYISAMAKGIMYYLLGYFLGVLAMVVFFDFLKLPADNEVFYCTMLGLLTGATACAFSFKKEERKFNKVKIYVVLIFVLASVAAAYVCNKAIPYVLSFVMSEDYMAAFLENNNKMFLPPLAMRLLSYGILAPVGEEFLFRGVIFGRLSKIMPWFVAALLSAILFALYHGNLPQGIYAFIMGLIFAFAMKKTDNMYVPMILHSAANLFITFIA